MANQLNNVFLSKSISDLNKKSNVEKIRYNLFSIYSSIVQSRVLFPNNKDIKKLTNNLPLSRPAKDYLFAARPQIIARLVTEINNADDKNIYLFLEEAKKLIETDNKASISPKNKESKTNYIDNLLDKYSRGSNSEK